MRSVMSLVVAGAAGLLSTSAFAADVPIAAPPPPYGYAPPPAAYAPPPVYAAPTVLTGDEFSGWYLRGDIGVTSARTAGLFNVLYETAGTSVQTVGAGFGGSAMFGIGVGYQFAGWFRADFTGEYRAKASIHGLDIVRFNGATIGTDEYRGNKEEWVALVNLYADLGTWWCITPFIGVGIGGAKTTISSFIDVNTPNAGVAFAFDQATYTFAYALHAGLGYKVSNNLTMELAYRYLHTGDVLSGDLRTFTGVNLVNNPMHFNGVSSHDLKLGVRWTCCDPPPAVVAAPPIAAPIPAPAAPPVLMRRG